METEKLVRLIQQKPKKTPLLALVDSDVKLPKSSNQIIFGQQQDVLTILEEHFDHLKNVELYCPARNSAMELLKIEHARAQIEYGAIVRDGAEINDSAIIMMGAILNCGCKIGKQTIVDMGAVVGAWARIGDHCHIGANAVINGTLEMPSEKVVIEDDVFIGPGAVILEGVHVAKGAVVAPCSVVFEDVEQNAVVAGCPARMIKIKDKKTEPKTQWIEALRKL